MHPVWQAQADFYRADTASLDELKAGLGRLYEKHLLPSAYEVWVGPRPEGHLALRYAYHANRLAAMLQARA